MALAKRLVAHGDRALDRLELPEAVRAAVDDARRIVNPSARNRALRRVRIALRGPNADLVRQKLEARDAGFDPRTVEHWSERLVAGGDAELDAFVAACPTAERQRLRQLVRSAQKASEPDRVARRRALSVALREYLYP